MTRASLFIVLAAAVPFATIWNTAPAERSAHGLTVSPFGWPSLLFVHCIAAIPLALVVSSWLIRRAEFRVSTWIVALVGALSALVCWCLIGEVATFLAANSIGFEARCAVRTFICVSLALPWAAIAGTVGKPEASLWSRLINALVIAVILPAVWANKLATDHTAIAQNELAAHRMARALATIDGICDLDPSREIVEEDGKLKVPTIRGRLAEDLKFLAEDVSGKDPSKLSPKDRLLYANALLSLDRKTEAEHLLRELVRSMPTANLSFARTLHLSGQYEASDAAIRDLLAVGLPDAAKNPKALKACLDAYDLLVENATKRGSHADREAALRQGLEKLPSEEAYFRFQLGRHYKLTGQPIIAIHEIDKAVHLDRRFGPMAETLIRDMRENTPACLIRR